MQTALHEVARYREARVSQSWLAPSLLAAYALGATLWAPAFVLAATLGTRVAASLMPGLMPPDVVITFALAWLLRVALYARGAQARWDYGYGINGVIVNRQLMLPEKMRHIARDWFGRLLIGMSTCFTAAALAAVIAA